MQALLTVLGLGTFGIYTEMIIISCITIGIIKVKKNENITKFNYINFLLLLAFTVTYSIIMYFYNKFSLSFLIVPWIAYYLGSLISNEEKNEKYILAIALGFMIHALLNFVYSMWVGNISDRNTLDVWNGQISSATLQGLLLVMYFSSLYYIITYIKNAKQKIAMLVIFFVGIIYNLIIATRTTLLITMIVFVAAFLLDYFISKDKERLKKHAKRIIICILIGIIVIGILYITNIFGIGDKINESQLVKRLTNLSETNYSNNVRFLALKDSMAQIFKYPLGGYQMELVGISYVHNLWLDVNYSAGIIPFAFIVMFTTLTIRNLIIFLKNKERNISYKILVFSVYLGVLINFAVEPIIEGAPYSFIMFCLINGMIDQAVLKEKGKGEENENIMDS